MKKQLKLDINKFFGFHWSDLFWLDFEIDNAFDALLKLNENQEMTLNETEENLKSAVKQKEEDFKELQLQDRESYINQLFYIDEQIILELKRLQRYSIVISAYAIFESKLKKLCESIEKQFDFKVKIDDLNSSDGDIKKLWLFLVKVYEIDHLESESKLTYINQNKFVRNIVTHHDGVCKAVLVKKIPKLKLLDVEDFGDDKRIFIQNGYVQDLIERMKNFNNLLLEVIDKRYTQLSGN